MRWSAHFGVNKKAPPTLPAERTSIRSSSPSSSSSCFLQCLCITLLHIFCCFVGASTKHCGQFAWYRRTPCLRRSAAASPKHVDNPGVPPSNAEAESSSNAPATSAKHCSQEASQAALRRSRAEPSVKHATANTAPAVHSAAVWPACAASAMY